MKKKFKFRLETVEKVRKARENEALKVLVEMQKKHQEALELKKSFEKKRDESLQRRESLGVEKFDAALSFQLETQFILGMKQKITQTDYTILRAKKFVDKAMRDYLQAKKQTRALEVLREKEHEEFRKEMNKKEQLAIDEINGIRFAAELKESA